MDPLNILRRLLACALAAGLTASALFSPARASAQENEPSPPATPPSAPVPPATSTTSTFSAVAAEPPQQAEHQRPKPKAWAINLAYAHNTWSGDDFDGSRALVRAGEGVFIPELGSGNGFLLGLGYGLYPEAKGAFGFWSGLTYGATWFKPHSPYAPAASDSAILHDLEIQLRFAWRAARFVAPYAQLSAGYGFLPITGFHVTGSGTGDIVFDDNSVLFTSKSFGFGLGALFPLNETVSVDVFAGYRALLVTNVDGQDLEDNLNAGGWQFHVGPAFFL